MYTYGQRSTPLAANALRISSSNCGTVRPKSSSLAASSSTKIQIHTAGSSVESTPSSKSQFNTNEGNFTASSTWRIRSASSCVGRYRSKTPNNSRNADMASFTCSADAGFVGGTLLAMRKKWSTLAFSRLSSSGRNSLKSRGSNPRTDDGVSQIAARANWDSTFRGSKLLSSVCTLWNKRFRAVLTFRMNSSFANCDDSILKTTYLLLNFFGCLANSIDGFICWYPILVAWYIYRGS